MWSTREKKAEALRVTLRGYFFYHFDPKMSPYHLNEHHKPQSGGRQTEHIKFHHRTTHQSVNALKILHRRNGR